jgi:hypothetical protein
MDCDGCTLCCELLDIPWMDSPVGEYCKHCEIGKGCGIYDNAPKDCLDYQCAYNQMDNVSLNLRPDKCGVIFEKISDKLFIGTIDPKQEKPQDIVMKQIDAFLNDGYSVILHHIKENKPIIINTDNRTKESVWLELQEVEAARQLKLEKM